MPIDSSHAVDESARIVIVDDDPGLRELLTGFLVDHGLHAEAVESGAALRARLCQRPCDLVVLDMMMPGEDGLSVLRTLTQTRDAPDGNRVRLTEGEFLMLDAFVASPQTIKSRDDMIASAGKGENTLRSRTIDVNISRLRRKMQRHDDTEIIRTVRGNGYIFMPDVVSQ
ncbi:MAG: response regulator [Oxalobacteraceae bacterium]|nr:MAG: response regulator [Oxalobacteraceae bacterium]